jgi:hypothetical protein
MPEPFGALDVSPDGKRILISRLSHQGNQSVTLVTNFAEAEEVAGRFDKSATHPPFSSWESTSRQYFVSKLKNLKDL